MTWIDDIKPSYGTVTGRFVQVQWDSADDDLLPDVQPLNGSVTLTPTTPAGHISKAFAAIAPVTARIIGGEIVDQNETPGIRILATDADLGIDDWAWKATLHLDADVDIKPLTFKLAAGDTACLTDGLIPIASTPVQIMRGRQGISVVGAEPAGAGSVRFVLDDGTRTDPVPLATDGHGPWVTLDLLGDWKNLSTDRPLRARVTPSGVQVDGLIGGGATGSRIAQLPDDMTPQFRRNGFADADGGSGNVGIGPQYAGDSPAYVTYEDGKNAPAWVTINALVPLD